MPTQTFIQGALRVINSHQVHLSAGALTAAYFTAHSQAAGLPANAQAAIWVGFFAMAATLVREALNSFAEEDVAASNAAAQSSKLTMLQTGSSTRVVASGPAAASISVSPNIPAPPAAATGSAPIPVVVAKPKDSSMPPTKPRSSTLHFGGALLLVVSMLACFAGGCVSGPAPIAGVAMTQPAPTPTPTPLQAVATFLDTNPLTGLPWTEADVVNANNDISLLLAEAQAAGVKSKALTAAQNLQPILADAASKVITNQSAGLPTDQLALNDAGAVIQAIGPIKAALAKQKKTAAAVLPAPAPPPDVLHIP